MTYEIRVANQTRDPQIFSDVELAEIETMEVDADGFVRIGEISNGWLGEQSQYVGRYFTGTIDGYPKLVEGLTYTGNPNNYHSWKLRKEDVQEFIVRVRTHLWSNFQLCR